MPGSEHADHQPSDHALVEQANAGNHGALGELYRRHRNWCFGVAIRITNDPATADDAVHEAFLYLAKQFPGFTLDGKLTTYLYPVVRHRALKQRRATRRLRQKDRTASDPTQPATEPTDDLAPLARALAQLPEPKREALLMRTVHGMNTAETAAALRIPPGTVKSRLSNALQALRADPALRDLLPEP